MSSTEAKYFLHAAHQSSLTGGLAALRCDPTCLEVPVAGDPRFFPGVPNTANAREHCESAASFFDAVRSLSCDLATRERFGSGVVGACIAGTAKKSYYGNQAVYGLLHRIITSNAGITIEPSSAFKHAEANGPLVYRALCESSNVNAEAAVGAYKAASGTRADHIGEHGKDLLEQLYSLSRRSGAFKQRGMATRKICTAIARRHADESETREQLLHGYYQRGTPGRNLVRSVHEQLSAFRVRSTSARDARGESVYTRTYVVDNALYWVVRDRKEVVDPPRARKPAHAAGNEYIRVKAAEVQLPQSIWEPNAKGADPGSEPIPTDISDAEYQRRLRSCHGIDRRRAIADKRSESLDGGLLSASHRNTGHCYVLYSRDREDLSYLLDAWDRFTTHVRCRTLEMDNVEVRVVYVQACKDICTVLLEMFDEASRDLFLANNIGTVIDQVVWMSLADMAGTKYYDHVSHMENKAREKCGKFSKYAHQLRNIYARLPIDMRVDLFGLNKMSAYPQICAYDMVVQQHKKHNEGWDCSFSSGSDEDIEMEATREEMFVYMRFFYIRIFFKAHKYYPGVIRNGIDEKPWHRCYKMQGVPPSDWRDCTDIDLTSTLQMPVPDFDTYFTLADSACAPSCDAHYKSMATYKQAPIYEKRKLLYLLQCPDPADIQHAHEVFTEAGVKIPWRSVDKVDIDPGFSTDISTGARFERQKGSSRPFYQVCAPMGCLLSNLELTVRHLLRKVPQSLMSMSLKHRGESALAINDPGGDICGRVMMSDDKAAYSPHMDPYSQAMTADFFAEITGQPSFRSLTNVLLNNELYYRVHGRLVHYPSNGTDREGIRGAQNTWLEVVCHAYHARCIKDKNLYRGATHFVGFIDDALRRYDKSIRDAPDDAEKVRSWVKDLEKKLRCIGRELSWDKAYVSEVLSTILGEVYFGGRAFANGLKSYLSFGDIEEKLVEDLSSIECNYASKAMGAMSSGSSAVASLYSYVHMTLKGHHRFGIRVGLGHALNEYEYPLWCLTPIALGGAGLRGPLEMACTETANRVAAGIGNLIRYSQRDEQLAEVVSNVMNGELEDISDLDFMRDPGQVHVKGPRIRTQRANQLVRAKLPHLVRNPVVKEVLKEEEKTKERLIEFSVRMRQFGAVDVQEIKAYYEASAHCQIDSLVTKICSSDTAKSLLSPQEVSGLRRTVRLDALKTCLAFRYRLSGKSIPNLPVRLG